MFIGNIRGIDGLDDDELRAALKGGWDKELPAIKDENGVVIVGHRRLKLAEELGITPVIKMVHFGTGADADADRTRLANISNIGAVPMTRADRKRQAERLRKEGLSQEAIAHMLGVSQQTISLDLAALPTTGNAPSEPRKDKLGRKNAGRPKRKAKPRQTADKEETIVALAEKGMSSNEIADAVGSKGRAVRHVLEKNQVRKEAEAEIDPATLSMSAQQKLETAIRQHQRKLDATFEVRVLGEIKRRVDEIVLPQLRKQIANAKKIYELRKGAMDKATFNKIRRGLHPDSRQSISDKVLAEAFDTFMSLEKYLLTEKDSPTTWIDIPNSAAEWDKMRRKPRRPTGRNSMVPR